MLAQPDAKFCQLADEGWRMYGALEGQPFLVQPAIPILFFGDLDAYRRSPLRVITVGLNPSRAEFPAPDPLCRFERARWLSAASPRDSFYEDYLAALSMYFRQRPYSRWFNAFEPLLRGLDCSYYPGAPGTALHTDICSPLATNPTWSRLGPTARALLEQDGTPLWHALVDYLAPDVIIISVAQAHITRIGFPGLDSWPGIYTLERKHPYVVRMIHVQIRPERPTALVFGRAAEKPFGTVSRRDKQAIGQHLKGVLYAE